MKMPDRLIRMLAWKRPHNSRSEQLWVERFIMPYGPTVLGDEEPMAYVVHVPGESHTLFSAHVDTVHRDEGAQKIVIKGDIISKNDGTPLGADDAAGVWVLLEMIDAQVPGTYIFHRGEEQGGIGSKWMGDTQQPWLRQFSHAVAFDRKATYSIITHQWSGRCCSDVFAAALSDALNTQNEEFMYDADATGVYTDTAEYIDFIPECTNVSCGYYDEHTPNERLDVKHLVALRNACVALNWAALPAARNVNDKTDDTFGELYADDFPSLYDMTREQMYEVAMNDPEGFVDLVRLDMFDRDPDPALLPDVDAYADQLIVDGFRFN